MSGATIIEGGFSAGGASYGIVVGRFNGFIVESLLDGALDALKRHGADMGKVDVVKVPGAFEIPGTAKRMAETKKYDAVIALGAVIRGSTPHFDYVAGTCANGLAKLNLEHDIPVIFGVLTVDSIEQAIERAGTKAGNKGAEAAVTAVEMIDVYKQISG